MKIFNIILFILFMPIASLTNKILNCIVFIFFDNLLIKQAVYFKKFKNIGIAIDKN